MSNCDRCGKELKNYEFNRAEDGIVCDVCAGLKLPEQTGPESINLEIVQDDKDDTAFVDNSGIWKWTWGLLGQTLLLTYFLHPRTIQLLDRGYQIKGALFLSLEAFSFMVLSLVVYKLQKQVGIVSNVVFLILYNKILIGNIMEGGYQTGQTVSILVLFNILWIVAFYLIVIRDFTQNRKLTINDFK